MENGIKIMNLEGSDILKNNKEGLSINKDYKGVFATSLLGDKLLELGLNVNKEKTKDIIMINFNYGYTPQTAKSIDNDISENKNDIDKVIADKKVLIAKRKELTLLKKPYTTKIKDLMKQRKLQKNNEDKKPFTEEINRLNILIKSLKCDDNSKELISNLTEDIKILKELTTEGKQEINDMQISKEEIRDILYKEGFHLDFYKQDRTTKEYKKDVTIEYVFWYRSPSKSKTGNVCFINKKLHEDINFWQTMGIELPSENAKLVELEAYKSLTSSAIENKITLNPLTEILVVNDLDSFMEEMCNKVYVIKSFNNDIRKQKIVKYTRSRKDAKVTTKIKNAIRKNRTCAVQEGIIKIKNTVWDGMALLENGLFTGTNGMMVLRQHFFKICGFRTFISEFMKQWCEDNGKDYNTYTTKDRYGRVLFVKDLKCITTENAMKWEKFSDDRVNYEYWCSKVQEDDNLFGVCKVDHESKYLSKQRMSFQMINTLPIDKEKTFELCKNTIEYVDSLKVDNEVFITHLKRTKSNLNANGMIIDLYENNKGFYNSELFRKFKVSTISEYKETLRAGKLLTEADNLTVCGNPYSLLLHSVGALDDFITGNVIEGYEDPTLPTLDKDKGVSVYTTRFEDEELCAFRSPHNSPNNIMFFKNLKTNPIMETYFPFSKNIIAVDLFNTNLQSRGNGFDEDSDFFYVTNNSICIEGAKEAQKFNTIENCIEQTGKKYNNTMQDLAIIDNGLAKSRYSIGLSSNLAQIAMSWYWNDPTNKELADIVCINSVLAQCAIDNSKRQYMVNLEKEIARISKLDCMQVRLTDTNGMVTLKGYKGERKEFNKFNMAKPYFWKFIKEIKEKEAYKITENEIDTTDKTEEQVLELKKVEKSRVLDLKVKQKQKNKKEKAKKEVKLIGSCLNVKICPMDFIQDALDTIKVNKDNGKYTKDIDFVQVAEGVLDKMLNVKL